MRSGRRGQIVLFPLVPDPSTTAQIFPLAFGCIELTTIAMPVELAVIAYIY